MRRIALLLICVVAAAGCANILGLRDVTETDAGATLLDGPRPSQQSDPGSYLISTSVSYTAADGVAAALGSSKQRTLEVIVSNANRNTQPLCQVDPEGAVNPLASAGDGEYGFCWSENDPNSTEWAPQGITTTGDALPSRSYLGLALAVVTWRNTTKPSTRITVAPASGYSASAAYRHLLLVTPKSGATFTPVACGAGGAVWYGDLLYVACTDSIKIFDWTYVYSADTDPDDFCDNKVGKFMDGTAVRYCADMAAYFMMQVGQITSPSGNVRFSSISLDQASTPDRLVVSEDAPSAGGKLIRFDLDPATRLPSRTSAADAYDMPFALVRGATTRAGKFWFQSDDGTVPVGGVVAGTYGQLRFWDSSTGQLTAHTSAYGGRAISFWPGIAGMPEASSPSDTLFTLTEQVGFRAVIAVPRTSFE